MYFLHLLKGKGSRDIFYPFPNSCIDNLIYILIYIIHIHIILILCEILNFT